MRFQNITAVIRYEMMEKVERQLQSIGVLGLSVTHVCGYGEYANTFRQDWQSSHMRIEVFTATDNVDPIVNTLLKSTHSGLSGDGIIAVLPVEEVYRIRTQTKAKPDEI